MRLLFATIIFLQLAVLGFAATSHKDETFLESTTYIIRSGGHTGTAFSLIHKGYKFLVTNHHVCGDVDSYEVTRNSMHPTLYSRVARIKSDKELDLCIVTQPDTAENFLTLGTSASIYSYVKSMGYPEGSGPFLTEGAIATYDPRKHLAPGRDLSVAILFMRVHPGMSGSALVNANHEVVAVIHARDTVNTRLGYAIDVSTLRTFLEAQP